MSHRTQRHRFDKFYSTTKKKKGKKKNKPNPKKKSAAVNKYNLEFEKVHIYWKYGKVKIVNSEHSPLGFDEKDLSQLYHQINQASDYCMKSRNERYAMFKPKDNGRYFVYVNNEGIISIPINDKGIATKSHNLEYIASGVPVFNPVEDVIKKENK